MQKSILSYIFIVNLLDCLIGLQENTAGKDIYGIIIVYALPFLDDHIEFEDCKRFQDEYFVTIK